MLPSNIHDSIFSDFSLWFILAKKMKKYFKWCRSYSFWLIVSHSNETKALSILWSVLHWRAMESDLAEESNYYGAKIWEYIYLCLAHYLSPNLAPKHIPAPYCTLSFNKTRVGIGPAFVAVSVWILARISISKKVLVQHYLRPKKMKEHFKC